MQRLQQACAAILRDIVTNHQMPISIHSCLNSLHPPQKRLPTNQKRTVKNYYEKIH
jgi:hypothetical protein